MPTESDSLLTSEPPLFAVFFVDSCGRGGVVVKVVTAAVVDAVPWGGLLPFAESSLAFLLSGDVSLPLSPFSLASQWPTVARRLELLVASWVFVDRVGT